MLVFHAAIVEAARAATRVPWWRLLPNTAMVAAGLRQAFLQPDQDRARKVWRGMADQFRPRWPKLAALMDSSEHDVLAYMGFTAQHRVKLHSTNPLERLNKEVKRRADMVGIFPAESAIVRLIGAVLLEANDEWAIQHHYMQVEVMAELISTRALADRPWLTIERSPKYAPELNDIERSWRDLKRHHLANRTFQSLDSLDVQIHQAVQDMNQERAKPACHKLPIAA